MTRLLGTRRRHAARAAAVVTALIGIALLLAACGGGTASPGVANVKSASTNTSNSSSAGRGAPGAAGGGPNARVAANPTTNSFSGGGSQVAIGAHGGNRKTELKFSACMRANGKPNFPDPNAAGVIQVNLDPNSPQLGAAMKNCAKYRANGGQPTAATPKGRFTAQALAFSKCMRSHGITDFPDPQTAGGTVRLGVGRGPGAGDLDPNTPLFQDAQKACDSLIPGVPGSTGSK
ncbi:MAG TPA: hypothetical protein VHX66_17275 [Solirubrobacteraceae bacterium]|nr:hypothetical protein [Solirubrobacteraceae bacterium]